MEIGTFWSGLRRNRSPFSKQETEPNDWIFSNFSTRAWYGKLATVDQCNWNDPKRDLNYENASQKMTTETLPIFEQPLKGRVLTYVFKSWKPSEIIEFSQFFYKSMVWKISNNRSMLLKWSETGFEPWKCLSKWQPRRCRSPSSFWRAAFWPTFLKADN